MEKPKYFDAHSHISFSKFKDDYNDVIERMRTESVWTINVGVDKKSSEDSVSFAERFDGVFVAVGLHPTDTKKESFMAEDYSELVKNNKVVAIGECGLDYFRIEESDTRLNNEVGQAEEKDRQKREFVSQIEFALENDLPLMLHCRPNGGSMDAYEDVLDLLEMYKKEYGDKLRGNSHFFVGNSEIGKRFVNLGFSLSFTGVITFASDYDEVVKETPIDMILTETDSPYAAPVPYRGKRNEPIYVKEVVKRIAELKDMSQSEVEKNIVGNSLRVFGISP